VLTLIIAAVAAVVAALVVSHFWQSGTLWATAMTPVIVALVKETLERPAQRVREVTVVPRQRHPDEQLVVEEVEPAAYPSAPAEPAGYRTYGVRRKHWKLAILTGLAAFAIGVAILTVPELVAGRSIIHSGKDTTVFGGTRRARAKQQTKTQTVTTTVPSQTQTTTTPAQTSTTPTTTTTTPAQTTTTPAPQNTATTPPSGQTTPTVPTP
jgi:hypothetical protein